MITLILIILAGICNGFMDTLNVFFTTCRLKKLNPLFWDFNQSWKRKWKNGDKAQGEKFLGSSTFFVCVTDAWHLFKTIMIVLIAMAIGLYLPIFGLWDILIYISAFCLSFELTYRFLKQ